MREICVKPCKTAWPSLFSIQKSATQCGFLALRSTKSHMVFPFPIERCLACIGKSDSEVCNSRRSRPCIQTRSFCFSFRSMTFAHAFLAHFFDFANLSVELFLKVFNHERLLYQRLEYNIRKRMEVIKNYFNFGTPIFFRLFRA